MPEEAVLDAAPSFDTSLETSTDTDSSIDTSLDTTPEQPESGDEPEGGDPAAQDSDEPVVSNGRLSPATAKFLRDIQKAHPKTAANIKRTLLEADSIRQIFPGGRRQAAEVHRMLKDVGGAEGLKVMRSKIGSYGQIDDFFSNGEGSKFADSLTESPETIEMFKAVAPAFVDKYFALDPEAAGILVANNLDKFRDSFGPQEATYVCQRITSDMQSPLEELGGMSFFRVLDLIRELPADSPRMGDLHKALQIYANRLVNTARQPFEVKAKAKATPAADPRSDERERALSQREQRVMQQEQNRTRDNWRGEMLTEKRNQVKSELDRLAKGLNLSEQRRLAIQELTESAILRARTKTPDFDKTLEAFFKAGDKDGYLKYLSRFHRQEVPKAVAAAFGAVVDKPRKAAAPAVPKPNGTPQQRQSEPQRTAQSAPAGFERVTQRPPNSDIDLSRTTQSMIVNGQAVLKGGKRVQWGF